MDLFHVLVKYSAADMDRRLLLVVLLVYSFFSAVSPRSITNDDQAMVFLKDFHYMGSQSPLGKMKNMTDVKALPIALQYFQKFFGLNETGELDQATKQMMGEYRCGVPDMMTERDGMKRRRRRYALQGYVWREQIITYKFIKHTDNLPVSTTEQVIASAFQMWSDVTPLEFVKRGINEDAHIEISFPRLDHGDGDAFDGPGGTLAHAFFPNAGGDAHFDEDETFTDMTAEGINLLFVAVHEFGHSLGLLHSDVEGAIMFPTYLGFISGLKLHTDDILGIQALYGRRGEMTTTTTTATTTVATTTTQPGTTTNPATTAPTSQSVPDFCSDATVDAIFSNIFGDIYLFQGGWYAVVDPNVGIVDGYPRLIQDTFSGLPGNLDAAVNDIFYTYFFKGSQLWRYSYNYILDTYTLEDGYPVYLSAVGLPSDIEMAFRWSVTGRTYVTKGNLYYRMSFFFSGVDLGYPRSLARWNFPDLATPYTDAFSRNRTTILVAGDQYVKYDDMAMVAEEGYPQPVGTGELPFRCGSEKTRTSQQLIILILVIQMVKVTLG